MRLWGRNMDKMLEKLDHLRKEKGLSVFKLTEQAGLSENTVYNWYKKKSQPTIYALKAVCDVLGVSLSYFFAENTLENITAQEEALLRDFRSLNDEQKDLYVKLLNELTKVPK